MTYFNVEMTVRSAKANGFAVRYKVRKTSCDKKVIDDTIAEQENLVANVYEKGSAIIECKRWETTDEIF